jgi:hypothetical protein
VKRGEGRCERAFLVLLLFLRRSYVGMVVAVTRGGIWINTSTSMRRGIAWDVEEEVSRCGVNG